MNIKVWKAYFDEEEYEYLTFFKHIGEFIFESAKCVNRDFEISWIIIGEGEEVGYGLTKEMTPAELEEVHEKPIGLSNATKDSYCFIEYLDIFDCYQEEGFGTFFVDKLKKEKDNIILYANDASKDFWKRKGFKFLDESNLWMVWEK